MALANCDGRTLDKVMVTIAMATTYTYIFDLVKEAVPPADGIMSRTIFQDDRIKAVVFSFGHGQERYEHTPVAMLLVLLK